MIRSKIRGHMWKVRYSRLKSDFGQCDWERRTIRIGRGQSDREELDTSIHEITHAAFPDLREDVVHQFGADCSEILWQMGWRKES